MVEAIQCPSCQTRYGLQPVRVRTGLRRAQCFRCGDIFHIEMEVKRLISGLAPASTANVPLETLAEAIQKAPMAHEDHEEPESSLDSQELTISDLDIPEPGEDLDSALPLAPLDTAPIVSLAHQEASVEPMEVPPAIPDVPEPEQESAAPDSGGGTYATAKEAISRLFGDTPLAPSPTSNLRSALDMDAGMQALDDTLGGVRQEALTTKPFLPPTPPSSIAQPMREADLPSSTATLRLTSSEIAAASGTAQPKAVEPPEITQEEVTMVLPPPPPAQAPAQDGPVDPSSLRLRIGDQHYSGLDLATIAKWIEEGRVLEEHQVARGMSENWMDAVSVPALRAVFERLRRTRLGGDSLPPPPGIPDTGQLKRGGLFGGMFGKKE